MKNFLFGLCVLALTSCSFNVKNVRPVDVDYSGYAQSVVRISAEINDKPVIVATAWALDEDTLVSANHFCLAALELSVMEDADIVANGRKVSVMSVSNNYDLCLLYDDGHGLVPLDIVDSYHNVKEGQKVMTIGWPMGIVRQMLPGFVSEPTLKNTPVQVLEDKLVISSPVYGGVSGGPILNKDGKVIGVLVMSHPSFPHLSFGVRSVELLDFLETGN